MQKFTAGQIGHRVTEAVHPVDKRRGEHASRRVGIAGEISGVDEHQRRRGIGLLELVAKAGPPGQPPPWVTGSATRLDPAGDLGAEDEVEIGLGTPRQRYRPSSRGRCGR